jgi:hypothetical protein
MSIIMDEIIYTVMSLLAERKEKFINLSQVVVGALIRRAKDLSDTE